MPQAQIRKIEIGYRTSNNCLCGFKFYTKDGAVVLMTAYDWVGDSDFKTHTVLLEDGERVIGYKSGGHPEYPNCAWHYNF